MDGGDEIQSVQVAMSERERFTLVMFFTSTYKPKDKAERAAMVLAFKRLKLDSIVDRLQKPGGVNTATLSDAPVATPLNEETVNWVRDRLNETPSEKVESLIISAIETRFDAVKDGKYVLPDAAKPKAALASVPTTE